MKKFSLVMAIIFTLSFLAWGTVRIVDAVQFNMGCEQYLKRAADANSVEMAKDQLKTAIDYAESEGLTEGIVSIILKQPKNDIGFWYDNMKKSYEELEKVDENTSQLERTNILMKLRESLTDSSEDGTVVTIPDGISIYPNNVAFFWWGLASVILACTFWLRFVYLIVVRY